MELAPEASLRGCVRSAVAAHCSGDLARCRMRVRAECPVRSHAGSTARANATATPCARAGGTALPICLYWALTGPAQ